MAQGMNFDAALERNRAGTVFTTHTPVPAGIDRFPREMIVNQFGVFGDLPLDQVLALGGEDYEGGDPSKFNMAVMGFRLGQRANGVSMLHGEVSREMFQGLWSDFDTSEVPITSITNGVHHLTWVHHELLDLLEAPTGSTADTVIDGYDWNALAGVDSHTIWALKRTMRSELIAMTRARLAESSVNRGLPDRLGVRRARSRRRDLRVRPAGAVVQAADPDAARPGAAQGAAHRPEAADPDRDRRQVAPGRRGRQGADPADGAVRRRAGRAGADRLPARLRHLDGQAALPGLRRVDEQPAASVRGVRHLGDEGRAERGGEPVHPRRLVGRVVRPGVRLGDPVGGGDRRPGPARRPRGQGALRHHRERDRAAVLRYRPRRAARALDPDDPGDHRRARAQGAGLADGAGLRDQPVRAGRGARPGRSRRRSAALRPWPTGRPGSAKAWPGSPWTTSSRWTATRSRWAPRSTSVRWSGSAS